MIRVQSLKNTDSDKNSYLISAFADTKNEVTSGAEFIGLPEGASIEAGSTLVTADADVAFYKSDGTWNWVD